jgi:proteic killer suppression protein
VANALPASAAPTKPGNRAMNYPGSALHLLLPKMKERWAIKVSGNWRLTFEFKDGDALNVDIEDYH